MKNYVIKAKAYSKLNNDLYSLLGRGKAYTTEIGEAKVWLNVSKGSDEYELLEMHVECLNKFHRIKDESYGDWELVAVNVKIEEA